MAVNSTTAGGLNVYQLTGTVTDAEFTTALSARLISGIYVLDRFLFVDDDADMSGMLGGFLIDIDAFGFLVHTNSVAAQTQWPNCYFFRNVGLSVGNRQNNVREISATNTLVANNAQDKGLSMLGGAYVYAVEGGTNSGGGRFLDESKMELVTDASLTSMSHAVNEFEPTFAGDGIDIRGVTFDRCRSVIFSEFGITRAILYRCSLRTDRDSSADNNGLWKVFSSAVVLVSCPLTRPDAGTGNVLNFFSSNGSTDVFILNNFLDEVYFGAASPGSIGIFNANAGGNIWGGVLRRIEIQDMVGGSVRAYDSRSSTPALLEMDLTENRLISAATEITMDANARAEFLSFFRLADITGGGSASNTAFTNQRYTAKLFGKRCVFALIAADSGQTDIDPFEFSISVDQPFITRTEAVIQAATTVASLEQFVEHMHEFGVNSLLPDTPFENNLHEIAGSEVNIGAQNLVIDGTAAQAFLYDATGVGTLTINAIALATTANLSSIATSGIATLQNGANLSSSGEFTISGDLVLSEVVDLTNVTVTGSLTFEVAGAYTFSNVTINEVINTSGGQVTLNLVNGSVVMTNTGPDITVPAQAVPLSVTAVDTLGSPIENARVYLEASLGGGEADIALVNAFQLISNGLGAAQAGVGLPYAGGEISAGTDRQFIAFVASRTGVATLPTGLALGGQQMTLMESDILVSGSDIAVSAWTLNEAGIVAAGSQPNLVLTGGSGGTFRIFGGVYQLVNQASAITDSAISSTDVGTVSSIAPLTSIEGGRFVGFWVADRNPGNLTIDAVWTNATEVLENIGSSVYFGLSDEATSVGVIAVSVADSAAQTPRDMLVGITLQPSALPGGDTVLINELTGVSGTVTGSVVINVDTSIQNSRVRKADVTPLYQSSPLSGVISATTGLSITTTMIRDD